MTDADYMQIHLLELNLHYKAWKTLQDEPAPTWTQIKKSSCVLNKKESSVLMKNEIFYQDVV